MKIMAVFSILLFGCSPQEGVQIGDYRPKSLDEACSGIPQYLQASCRDDASSRYPELWHLLWEREKEIVNAER